MTREVCNFCGAEIMNPSSGCNCCLGEKLHRGESIIKMMCRNCVYHDDGVCRNESQKKGMNARFEVEELKIRNVNASCVYWKFDSKVILNLCE